MTKFFSLLPLTFALPLGACPQDFAQLTQVLSRDLHHYLNRSYTQLGMGLQAQTVSFPELSPLPIQEVDPSVKQLFLTVNHRRSGELRVEPQTYWLFLVQTPKGWRLAMAFTRVAAAPPIDVSDGALATAVRTWLRDNCWEY